MADRDAGDTIGPRQIREGLVIIRGRILIDRPACASASEATGVLQMRLPIWPDEVPFEHNMQIANWCGVWSQSARNSAPMLLGCGESWQILIHGSANQRTVKSPPIVKLTSREVVGIRNVGRLDNNRR